MNLLIRSSLVLVILQLIYLNGLIASEPKFAYYGPKGPCNWPRLFPDFCAGRRQSPINIPVSRTWYSSSLKNSLRFHDYSCSHPCDGEFELENKGTTLEVIVTSADASITLKDLGRKYILEQFHFHWGKVNSRGSEHHYSGRIFSAEMHLVHHSDKYSSVSEAVEENEPDSIAVLAVMIKVGRHNPAFEKFLFKIDKVIEAGKKESIPAFSIKKLLPSNTKAFFRYRGSLTTPDCNEIVVWTLFVQPIEISQRQINLYRSLKDFKGKHLVDNFRPIQPLNGRIVKRSFCRFCSYLEYFRYYKFYKYRIFY